MKLGRWAQAIEDILMYTYRVALKNPEYDEPQAHKQLTTQWSQGFLSIWWRWPL